MKYFERGEDEKALDLWKSESYYPLNSSDSQQFYMLALKLKDIKILDFEGMFTFSHYQV